LDYIRGLPEWGPKVAEALQSIADGHNTTEQQTNTNSEGQPIPPPAINGLTVTGQNGHFNVAITDNNSIYRGIRYYVEHADNPHFINAHKVALHDTRNTNLFLGNVTRYFRAYSAYSSSAPSAPAYHGSASQPIAVTGGGTVGGPSFTADRGSGTGTAGVGLSGPGPVPYRAAKGAPPTR
jgi:hypothetical protein